MGSPSHRKTHFFIAVAALLAITLAQCNNPTRAAFAQALHDFRPSPDLRTAGAPVRMDEREPVRKPPSAHLATFLGDSPNAAHLAAFSLATAQNAVAARLYNAINPDGILASYFSSLRYDPKYPPGNPNNYTVWMDGHEQDFLHVGDPGMLSGVVQGRGCEWSWLPDERGPSSYRVYDWHGRLLIQLPASDRPQFISRSPASRQVYVDSVLSGRDIWYTSIDNASGNHRPARCVSVAPGNPAFLHAEFELTPNPHPIYPAPPSPPDAPINIAGSVDVIGGSGTPVLQWLYHPGESTSPSSVSLVGGPTHWRVPAGVTLASDNAHWFGSPALRYCDPSGHCSDWWTTNENNRAAWSEYNTHMNILNTCSSSENADAVRMLLHIHSVLGSTAFELDDIIDKLVRARPEIFHAQDSAMPTDAQLFGCVGNTWPKYAYQHLQPSGFKTILNGVPAGTHLVGSGRIYEDVPWSNGLHGPYPFTLEQWRSQMQSILDDLDAGRIVWMIPTGDQAGNDYGARVRDYSFAVYELLNPYNVRGDSGGFYYGFSQIADNVFPEMFVDLGRPRIKSARRLADLYNARDGMYEREYERGTVYVCPPGGSCNPLDFPAPLYVVRASALPVGRGGARTYQPVQGMTLYPAQGAIVTGSPQ